MADLDPKIVGALRQIKSSISHTDRRTGITGKLNDDGTLNPDAESGLTNGYVWVRFDGESPRAATAVRCLMTGVAVGIPVVCALNVDAQEYEIIRIDPTRGIAALGADLVRSLGSPDKSVSYPTLVSSRDIVPGSLQAHSDGGLKVFIPSYVLANGRAWQNDGGGYTKTLTPTATSAKHSIALVGIDPAAATLNATAYVATLTADRNLGEELIDSDGVLTTTGLTDVQAVIDADPNIDWRGYVQLANGDTTLDLNTMRPLFWRVPVMTGADGSNAGRAGLVPAPGVTDNTKFLRGDGTYVNPTAIARQTVFTYEGALSVVAGSIRIPNLLGSSFTITKVGLLVNTAPTGAAIIVDVNKNGTTIFTTQANRPQIAAGANSGSTTTIDVASWADGDYLTMDIDQIGSTTPGSHLTVVVVFQ